MWFLLMNVDYIAVGEYIKELETKTAALSYTSLLFHWFHHFLIVSRYTEMYFMLHSFCIFGHFICDPLLSHCVPQGISIMELDAFYKSTQYWYAHPICSLKYLFCVVLIINVLCDSPLF